MFDMHSHILPYVDDGARDLYESVEMAYNAVENGTTVMAVTPHANQRGMFENYSTRDMQDIFYSLQKALHRENIPLRLIPGMEIYVTGDVLEFIKRGMLCPYAGTNIFLFEFPFESQEDEMIRMLKRMIEIGIRPMLAHPERYYCIQDDLEVLRRLINMGCLVQMNKGSVFDRFGAISGQTARNMLELGLVHVIGSDAHGVDFRTTEMNSIKNYIDSKYSPQKSEQILKRTPCGLLEGG